MSARATALAMAAFLALAVAGAATAGETAPAAGQPELTPASAADVLTAVRAAGAKAVVVNLWATWCTPCRQEFPDLMRFYRAYKDRGVVLLLVSGDFSSDTAAVRDFLTSQGVDFRTFLKSQKDEDFINGFDPQWSGALPATFVYDGSGQRRHSFLSPVTYDLLEHEVAPLVGATP